MPKNSVVRIVGLLSFIVFAIIFKIFWNSRVPTARSNETRLALYQAEKIITKLSEYKAQIGTYPCFLSEVPSLSEFEQFDKPPYYQATDRGYQLFVESPEGQNLIRYHDSIEWFPCLYRDSCPSSGFLGTCCGKARYPKCENHILPAKNGAKDCGHIPCEHLSEMVLGIVGKIEIPRPTRETFRSFREGTSMIEIFRAAGIPSKEVGSGLYVFIYQLEDGQSCSVGTDDIRGKAHYVSCK